MRAWRYLLATLLSVLSLQANAYNDPWSAKQWFLSSTGADKVYALTRNVNKIKVAVLDSGVSPIPDLKDHIYSGWNVNNSGIYSDWEGHGTMISSLISADCNNKIGIASMTCGAIIMPVEIWPGGKGTDQSDIAKGIYWAVDNGANVINISYDKLVNNKDFNNAADYALAHNVEVVIAAGNCGCEINSKVLNPNIIVVASVDKNNNISKFSTYGNIITISAPGEDIYTLSNDGSVYAVDGTSVAAPLVTATVAMMLSINPKLTPFEINNILISSATRLNSITWDERYGFGILNTQAAVWMVAQDMRGNDAPNRNHKQP